MAATDWTHEQARQHFFIYIERTGTADLLHELRASPVAPNPDVARLAATLHENLSSTAHATSAPFFTAMMGAQNGRTSAIQELIEHASHKTEGDALESAVMLLNDSGASITQAHETLRLLHERDVMPDAFQALLRQGTAMAWGAFETFSFDIFRLLFTEHLGLLDRVALAAAKGTPWGNTPRKLAAGIRSEVVRNSSMTHQDAFDSFNIRDSMSIRASRHFSSVLFPDDAALLSLLDTNDFVKLSARRHLLLHAAGVVDDKYVNDSGEALSTGSELMVTPRDLALGFRAASSAGAALARAASEVMTGI